MPHCNINFCEEKKVQVEIILVVINIMLQIMLTELNLYLNPEYSSMVPYLSLHHERPVHAHIINNSVDIHHAFSFNLENQVVNSNKGSCSSHTGTEKVK